MMGMCVLHLTCESTCRGRYRGPWISPALLELVDPWSEVLAANLAAAGALCRSFRHGFDTGWSMTGEGFNAEYCPRLSPTGYESMASYPGHDDMWRPGCGRPATPEGPEGEK